MVCSAVRQCASVEEASLINELRLHSVHGGERSSLLLLLLLCRLLCFRRGGSFFASGGGVGFCCSNGSMRGPAAVEAEGGG